MYDINHSHVWHDSPRTAGTCSHQCVSNEWISLFKRVTWLIVITWWGLICVTFMNEPPSCLYNKRYSRHITQTLHQKMGERKHLQRPTFVINGSQGHEPLRFRTCSSMCHMTHSLLICCYMCVVWLRDTFICDMIHDMLIYLLYVAITCVTCTRHTSRCGFAPFRGFAPDLFVVCWFNMCVIPQRHEPLWVRTCLVTRDVTTYLLNN